MLPHGLGSVRAGLAAEPAVHRDAEAASFLTAAPAATPDHARPMLRNTREHPPSPQERSTGTSDCQRRRCHNDAVGHGAYESAGLNVSGGRYHPAMATFAVRLVHGPGWDPSRPIREQDGWDEHAAFMDGLVDDGVVILGGPVGNGEQTLHVVEAAHEHEVRMRFAQDPWASAGLLQIGTIEPWALWLGRGTA